jgi:hypothetical protein
MWLHGAFEPQRLDEIGEIEVCRKAAQVHPPHGDTERLFSEGIPGFSCETNLAATEPSILPVNALHYEKSHNIA